MLPVNDAKFAVNWALIPPPTMVPELVAVFSVITAPTDVV